MKNINIYIFILINLLLTQTLLACDSCHNEIKELWDLGKHKGKVTCDVCHGNLNQHGFSMKMQIPTTNINADVCGKCHQNQFRTFITTNPDKTARLEKSLSSEKIPSPYLDKLLMGHGFTKEHNSPRSHAYMLIDFLSVDRSFGGRFQPKDGWQYVIVKPPFKIWNLLEDKYSSVKINKTFLPETAISANPNCIQCKSSDSIMNWKYLGEKASNVKWNRLSNVVEYAKQTQNSVDCIQCHDPHATKLRIVRDALIQALTKPEENTLWHKTKDKTNIKIIEFRGFRKIALLDKPDSKLQCGQCHVEYTCNPGIDPNTNEKIDLSDARTNQFPLKDVFQIYDHYNKLKFRDFKHDATGALLIKSQHPDIEVFWNSKHDLAGVSCNDCHMPKMKDENGNVFTSHWQTNPRYYIKETCLECHSDWTEKEAIYIIDSIKNYTKGKMRKAEFWIGMLIDKIVEAKKLGVDKKIINEANEQHQKAHILWDWWASENSNGFHNPDQARESLTRSIEEAKKGIELLEKK